MQRTFLFYLFIGRRFSLCVYRDFYDIVCLLLHSHRLHSNNIDKLSTSRTISIISLHAVSRYLIPWPHILEENVLNIVSLLCYLLTDLKTNAMTNSIGRNTNVGLWNGPEIIAVSPTELSWEQVTALKIVQLLHLVRNQCQLNR